MNFNELIEKNKAADEAAKSILIYNKKVLTSKFNNLINKIDDDLIQAIYLFGKHDYDYEQYGTIYKTKSWSYSEYGINLVITVFKGHRGEAKDLDVFVREGSFGVHFNTLYKTPNPKIFGAFLNEEYCVNDIDASVWINNDNKPDLSGLKVNNPDNKRKALSFASARRRGDERDWFERVEFVFDKFIETFKDYLEERATTKE